MDDRKPPQSELLFRSFGEAIASVIQEEVRKLHHGEKRMLTRDEAALYLGCSEGTVDNLTEQGKLHPSRYMRFPMYDLLELDKLIQDSKQAG